MLLLQRNRRWCSRVPLPSAADATHGGWGRTLHNPSREPRELLSPVSETRRRADHRQRRNAGNDDQPMLSPSQLALGGNWQRSEVAFSQASMISQDISGRHIVQDNVADCSLVAALIVGAEHHAKFGSRVSTSQQRPDHTSLVAELKLAQLGFSCLFPQDDAGLPMRSETGVYEARFMVNGAWRRVSSVQDSRSIVCHV